MIYGQLAKFSLENHIKIAIVVLLFIEVFFRGIVNLDCKKIFEIIIVLKIVNRTMKVGMGMMRIFKGFS